MGRKAIPTRTSPSDRLSPPSIRTFRVWDARLFVQLLVVERQAGGGLGVMGLTPGGHTLLVILFPLRFRD